MTKRCVGGKNLPINMHRHKYRLQTSIAIDSHIYLSRTSRRIIFLVKSHTLGESSQVRMVAPEACKFIESYGRKFSRNQSHASFTDALKVRATSTKKYSISIKFKKKYLKNI